MSSSPFPFAIKLSSGYDMPLVGLGTGAGAGENVNSFTEATEIALKAGYGLIDTAWYYRSEKAIGEGIRRSGVPRSKIFLTTKVWPTMLYPDKVRASVAKSLTDLGTDYIDLLLVHWPFAVKTPDGANPYSPKNMKAENFDPSVNIVEIWRIFEKLVAEGVVRSIGVSNMNVNQLKAFLPHCKIKPAVNQIELTPYLPQHELVQFCKNNNIVCTAYGPLGQDFTPRLRDDPLIAEIASKHGKTVGQVLISWAVQRGTAVVPKSTNEGRIKQNIQLVKLDEEDMAKLNALSTMPGRKERRYYEVYKVWGIDAFETKKEPSKYPMPRFNPTCGRQLEVLRNDRAVTIRVRKLEDLVAAPDPDPWRPDLNTLDDVVSLLVSARTLPKQIIVRAEVEEQWDSQARRGDLKRVAPAVRALAEARADDAWMEARAIQSDGIRQAPFSIGVFAVTGLGAYGFAYLYSNVVGPSFGGALCAIVGGLLATIAWVSSWMLMEYLLYDWRDPGRRATAWEKIAEAEELVVVPVASPGGTAAAAADGPTAADANGKEVTKAPTAVPPASDGAPTAVVTTVPS